VEVVRTIEEFRTTRAQLPGPVGLFPTLGGVHAGHLALVDQARAENASVVSTLFLNPTQFGEHEDLDRYPAEEAADLEQLGAHGVDLVLVPPREVMYPPGFDATVHLGGVTDLLEGARRPGHFDGVTTVVLKLFNITTPDRAYFGEKDAQQLRVIRQMVRDLDLPVEIVACPTVRDEDGLALSSRNAYLSAEERVAALSLSRGLRFASDAFAAGERDADMLRDLVRGELASEALVRVDYVSLADDETLVELEGEVAVAALLSLAVHVGETHLIDNVTLGGRSR
jgi:pantoate--beta-alanine ligase